MNPKVTLCPIGSPRLAWARLAAHFVALLLAACGGVPLLPFAADSTPLVLVPMAQAGVHDRRARFREIYCAVLGRPAAATPDHRDCEDALTRLGAEPATQGRAVDLTPSKAGLVAALVPGVGYACIEPWLQNRGVSRDYLQRQGFGLALLQVDALSSSARNARQIRDQLMAMPLPADGPRLVLVGYSKGAPDVLEAVVAYPEIRSRIAAVVSLAGAVGGSPLANDAEQYQADLLRHFPGATCDAGDGGAVESLRTDTRKAWLAANPLPRELRSYSVITLPQPEGISAVLAGSHRRLSQVDARNDSQLLFYDQVIPGSALLGYLNADHWAVVVPIAREHTTLASIFVTHNDYPREALLEAVMRQVEEDLKQPKP